MSRVFTALFLVVVLAVPAWAEQSAAEQFNFPFTGKVKATELNIRSGPSDKFPVLSRVKYGDSLTVLGQDKDWYKVTPPAGIVFYVSNKFLHANGASAEVAADVLNVRAQANTTNPPVGQLKRGDAVTILGTSGEWTQIAPPANFGVWVSAKYIDCVGPASANPAPDLEDASAAKSESKSDGGKESGATDSTYTSTSTNGASLRDVQARELFELANENYMTECCKDPQNWQFDGVIQDYQAILQMTEDPNLTELIESRLSMIDLRLKMRDQILSTTEADRVQGEQLKAVEARYQALLAERQRLENSGREDAFDAVGWLYPAGRFIDRPSAWRLEKGGKIIVYIDVPENSDIRLNEHGFAYVGVKGSHVEHNGKDVIMADQLVILKK